MEFNEELYKQKAEQHISKCRAGDWNHALRVVEWVRKLGEGREDLKLLLAAAYIHDIGWKDVLPNKKLTFEELLQYEQQANKNSIPFTSDFLKEFLPTDTELATVLRLVRAADAHISQLKDEEIIVDADNLSKLDINHLKEKYEETEWLKIYNLWADEFPNRMKTEMGRSLYPRLLQELELELKPPSDN